MKKSPAPEPAIIVIFGITGDLAQRKLLPALYHLIKDGLLNPQTKILGITRRHVTKKELLNNVELCINEIDKICDPVAVRKMGESLQMHHMDVTHPGDYDTLHELLDSMEHKEGVCMNRLYYLSIPPQVFGPIVRFMGEHGMNASCQHGEARTRLLVEKPFGYDLSSARLLIEDTGQHFTEEQVFRIDHYLAKETVQDILQFRFANPIFLPIWNHKNVESIMIKATEELGIENRVNFYEQTGALRDLIQSHLLQLLALVTMELPALLQSGQIHKNKQLLFDQVQPVPPDQIPTRAIRAQYMGYKEQVGKPKSITETYAALELYIDNPRWKDVPMKLITGKALGQKRTDITLQFRADDNGEYNRLTFRIQPNEGIELRLKVKKPGFTQATETALMDFSYETTFDNRGHPDAYERVLVDAVRGDHTLFATAAEVLAGWKIVQPVIDAWAKNGNGLLTYTFGSDGPNTVVDTGGEGGI
jgi:glucose-6-phosphate 1-dehydrogenase